MGWGCDTFPQPKGFCRVLSTGPPFRYLPTSTTPARVRSASDTHPMITKAAKPDTEYNNFPRTVLWCIKMTCIRMYFGYGSNLWLDQVTRRCPKSKFTGLGRLRGWKWFIMHASTITDTLTSSDRPRISCMGWYTRSVQAIGQSGSLRRSPTGLRQRDDGNRIAIGRQRRKICRTVLGLYRREESGGGRAVGGICPQNEHGNQRRHRERFAEVVRRQVHAQIYSR